MTAAEVRETIEAAGGVFAMRDGAVVFSPPLGGLASDLRALLGRYRNAIAAHVALYPCKGCGQRLPILPMRCTRCAALARRRT